MGALVILLALSLAFPMLGLSVLTVMALDLHTHSAVAAGAVLNAAQCVPADRVIGKISTPARTRRGVSGSR